MYYIIFYDTKQYPLFIYTHMARCARPAQSAALDFQDFPIQLQQ